MPKVNRQLPVAGGTLFFPAAIVYAIFILPASVLAMLGRTEWFPGLVTPSGHAHEMLFGFGLAIVSGNQIGAMARVRLATMVGLWLVSRVTFLFAPQSAVAITANIAFAAILAAHIAPRLFRAGQKMSNRALPVVLTAICASGILVEIARGFTAAAFEHAILMVAVLLFSLLLLFMGGRVLAPAVAGQFYRQRSKLNARVQPRVESGLILALAVATVSAALPNQPVLRGLAAAAVATAGTLAAVRLLRWRLWALHARPDLLCLAAGYFWVALGLLLLGASFATDRYQSVALHTITVGGLGTLALNIIAMTWLLKARQDPARAQLPIWGTALIAVATLARALAGFEVLEPLQLLLTAALCWSGAFALLLVLLIRSPGRPPRTGAHNHHEPSTNGEIRDRRVTNFKATLMQAHLQR